MRVYWDCYVHDIERARAKVESVYGHRARLAMCLSRRRSNSQFGRPPYYLWRWAVFDSDALIAFIHQDGAGRTTLSECLGFETVVWHPFLGKRGWELHHDGLNFEAASAVPLELMRRAGQ